MVTFFPELFIKKLLYMEVAGAIERLSFKYYQAKGLFINKTTRFLIKVYE